MKQKFLITLVAGLLVSGAVMAQFHIGAKGGVNIMKVDGASFKDKFSYGYHIGGYVELGGKNKLSVQPEVLLNQFSTTLDSNYKNVYNDVLNSDQGKVKFNYLSIPILLNYKLVGPLTLQAGPQFSILMDQEKNLLQNGGEAFKKGDFSMVGGIQFKFSALRLSGRYIVGLNNINDIDNREQWKNQGFQVSLGLGL